jgi:P-type Cu+ transporter
MTPSAPTHVELPVTGRTCASCAVRIEHQLNKLEGVSASVNYATGRATVALEPGRVTPEDLITTIEATGYEASLRPLGRGLSRC